MSYIHHSLPIADYIKSLSYFTAKVESFKVICSHFSGKLYLTTNRDCVSFAKEEYND